jgi:DNA-directed RNA polymerase specialized sigma24 family protein
MSRTDEGSITGWLVQLKQGNDAAVQPLWERYFGKLVGLARTKLCAMRQPLTDEDEEDAALSAFHDLCAGARDGRFPRLADRDDLWRILIYLTTCKAVDQMRRRTTRRRGGGRVALETDLRAPTDGAGTWSLDCLVGTEPSPEFAARVAEECQNRVDCLDDPTLRRIALMKLACYSNEEIRATLGCSLRSITLKLELIRKLWESNGEP